MDLLRRRASLRNPEASRETTPVNLSEARREFGLPAYQAHDALTDAVATAELFLTLRRALGAQTGARPDDLTAVNRRDPALQWLCHAAARYLCALGIDCAHALQVKICVC